MQMIDSMVPEQRRFVGIILLVVGLVSLSLTAAVLTMISSARHATAARYAETQQSCKTRLAGLGGTVTTSPGRLTWTKENLQEGPVRLGEASIAGVLCPGWRMRSACMGTECPDSNAMRVVLEPMNAVDD